MTPARFLEITARYRALRLVVGGDFCLDRYFELVVMQGINECLIQLQEWFASGTNDKTVAAGLPWPLFRDGISHGICVSEFVPALSVNTNEIGVAELADRT